MRSVLADRLTLEPLMAAHADAMFQVLSDPAIYAHENSPPPSVGWLRERYARLESRRSGDGRELWLNWVIRLPGAELIGYVQATVPPTNVATIAYELGSGYWGRGLGSAAVRAMIDELRTNHQVRGLAAVLKRTNQRSLRLLERLEFAHASTEQLAQHQVAPEELLMVRDLRRT